MGKKETFTVMIPGGYCGEVTQHNITFINGIAKGVPAGQALDDFKDWGYEIIPEFEEPVPVTEADVAAVLEAAAEGPAEEPAPVPFEEPVIEPLSGEAVYATPGEPVEAPVDGSVTDEEIAQAMAEFGAPSDDDTLPE